MKKKLSKKHNHKLVLYRKRICKYALICPPEISLYCGHKVPHTLLGTMIIGHRPSELKETYNYIKEKKYDCRIVEKCDLGFPNARCILAERKEK